MTTSAQQHHKATSANEFSQLGSRLVRFGQAMQEPSTTVNELMRLAQACGINLKLRVVGESDDSADR